MAAAGLGHISAFAWGGGLVETNAVLVFERATDLDAQRFGRARRVFPTKTARGRCRTLARWPGRLAGPSEQGAHLRSEVTHCVWGSRHRSEAGASIAPAWTMLLSNHRGRTS